VIQALERTDGAQGIEGEELCAPRELPIQDLDRLLGDFGQGLCLEIHGPTSAISSGGETTWRENAICTWNFVSDAALSR
jgi:hypothetical protein